MYIVPVVVANFGRDETNAEFVTAVLNMIEAIQKNMPKRFQDDPARALKRAIIGISELDEADKPPEHKLFLKTYIGSGGGMPTLVNWNSFEPMILGSGLKVGRTYSEPMCGGVPKLTPNRTLTIGVGVRSKNSTKPGFDAFNHHAPRNTPELATEIADCMRVHRRETVRSMKRSHSGIAIGDWNDAHYPVFSAVVDGKKVTQKTAVHDRLDYIRFWNGSLGATLEPIGQASFKINIDKHVGHVALFAVS